VQSPTLASHTIASHHWLSGRRIHNLLLGQRTRARLARSHHFAWELQQALLSPGFVSRNITFFIAPFNPRRKNEVPSLRSQGTAPVLRGESFSPLVFLILIILTALSCSFASRVPLDFFPAHQPPNAYLWGIYQPPRVPTQPTFPYRQFS